MDREEYQFIAKFIAENFGEARTAMEEMAGLGDAAQGAADDFEEADAASLEMAENLGSLVGTLAKVAVGFFSLQAAYGYLSNAMSAALPFDAKLAETSTLIQGTVEEMALLEEQARAMAVAFGTDAAGQVGGFYQAISAGVGGVAQAADLLDAANKLAIGGVTSTVSAVDALTTATNAYRAMSLTAADASDIMFVGIKAGKTTAEELSSALGQIVPIASSVGVSFDEVVGSVAALTTQGQSTAMAVTGMRGVISSVIRPVESAAKAAERLGIDFSVAGLRAKGLQGFLQEIVQKTGGSSEVIAELFTSVEALNAVLSFSGGGGQAFAGVMDMMANRAGAADEAFGKVADSLSQRLNVQLAYFRDITLEVGQVVLSIVVPALETVTSVIDFFRENVEVIVAVLVGLAATTLPALVAALTAATGGFTFAMIAAGLMTGVLNPLAAAAGIATAAMTALRVALTLLGGPIGILVGAAVGLATYFFATREAAKSLDEVMGDSVQTSAKLAEVNAKLQEDYDRLAKAKKTLEEAEASGAQAAQNAATVAVEAIQRRITANEQLKEQLAIIKRAEVDNAQAALDEMTKNYEVQVRAAYLVMAQAVARANKDRSRDAFKIMVEIDTIMAEQGIAGLVGKMQDWTKAAQDGTLSTRHFTKEMVDSFIQIVTRGQELALSEEQVADLRAALETLLGAGQAAADGLNTAAAGAGNLAGAAFGATGAIQGLLAMMPGFQQALAVQAKVNEANAVYKKGIEGIAAAIDAGDMSFERAAVERERLAKTHATVVAELDGTAKSQREATKALEDYTDQARLGAMDARAQAVEREARAYREVTEGITKNIKDVDARNAALARAEEAHQQNMASIAERFSKKGGSGGGKGGGGAKSETAEEVEELGRLAEVAAEYRRETQELIDTMFLDADTREARADYLRMEQQLQSKGVELTEQEQEALMRLVEARRLAVQENQRLLPQLYQALDQASKNIADASDVASSLVGTLTSTFDNAIDHILEKGFSDMDGLADIFASAFKQMGAELIKFALQAMILQPILERLKSSLSNMGSGGGGFFGFLGNLFGGIFGGGTRTLANAKGNVFTSSQTIPMALLAEAGAEALMPLTRASDGTLAVRALAPATGAEAADDILQTVNIYQDVQTELASNDQLLSSLEALLSGMLDRESPLSAPERAADGLYAPAGYADPLESVSPPEGRFYGPGGGVHIGTYSPSYHMTVEKSGAPGAEDASPEQNESFMKALDAHMRAAFAEFLTEQQRNGGMLNPTARPYGV